MCRMNVIALFVSLASAFIFLTNCSDAPPSPTTVQSKSSVVWSYKHPRSEQSFGVSIVCAVWDDGCYIIGPGVDCEGRADDEITLGVATPEEAVGVITAISELLQSEAYADLPENLMPPSSSFNQLVVDAELQRTQCWSAHRDPGQLGEDLYRIVCKSLVGLDHHASKEQRTEILSRIRAEVRAIDDWIEANGLE